MKKILMRAVDGWGVSFHLHSERGWELFYHLTVVYDLTAGDD